VITLAGVVIGLLLVLAAMSVGGSPLVFLDAASAMMVIGGTLAVTAVSFSLEEIKAAPKALSQVLFHKKFDPTKAARDVLQLSERARKDGLLELERTSKRLSSDPFLHKAIRLVADGANADEVEKILRQETFAIASIHMKSVAILRRAADVSPAMGLIGTLVGLVKMLGSLNDPASIGPSMAIALLTTFYGAMLAHMIFLPLATRAERNAREESLLNSVYTLGATSIGRQENPRRLEMLINTVLPPAKRIQYFR
jgi:chemotaxis protein MotA